MASGFNLRNLGVYAKIIKQIDKKLSLRGNLIKNIIT